MTLDLHLVSSLFPFCVVLCVSVAVEEYAVSSSRSRGITQHSESSLR